MWGRQTVLKVTSFKKITTAVLVLIVSLFQSTETKGCTSAIISARLSPYGRPILWKHRDTGNVDNFVEYVPASGAYHAYTALFNVGDKEMREAWTGMNDAGFAIMNTASYNLKDDELPEKEMDREGIVMTEALKKCITVDDFACLLDTLPKPLGVEANFGVLDASGNGAYFETNNNSYTRFNLSDAPEGYLIRTNYSHSGRPDEGFGFIREQNAAHFISRAAADCSVTPEFLTETVSRSFWHSLIGEDMARDGERWAVDQDFIPRYKSSATIAIEGCVPGTRGNVSSEYIMWTGLGYPPCSEIKPVFCRPDGVDDGLRPLKAEGHARLSDEAKERRGEVFPIRRGNGDKYIDMQRLFNSEGTGFVQQMTRMNAETYRNVRKKLHH